jgi:hypothetical protein
VVGVSQRLTEEVLLPSPYLFAMRTGKGEGWLRPRAKRSRDGVQNQNTRTTPVENIDQKSGTEFSPAKNCLRAIFL